MSHRNRLRAARRRQKRSGTISPEQRGRNARRRRYAKREHLHFMSRLNPETICAYMKAAWDQIIEARPFRLGLA